MQNRHMRGITIFLIVLSLVPLASAADFLLRNQSDTTQHYMMVNGTTGRVGINTILTDSILTVYGNVSLNNALYVSNLGKIGINTRAPTDELTIFGNLSVGNITAENINATNDICLISGNCLSNRGTLTTVGSMTGTSVFSGSSADNDWLGLGSGAGRIAFDDQPTDYVNILSAFVGINIATPSYYLHVNGNASINNTLFVNDKVGINLTNPSYMFQTRGTFNLSDNLGAGILTEGDGNVVITLG